MKQIKKVSILLIIASALGIIAGCGIVQVNPEKDRAMVVAEVNGEEILKGEVLDRLDREKAYYNLTEEAINDKNNEEQVLEVKKAILDQLATEKLLNQKASEDGFVVTDELREDARGEIEDIKKDIENQLKEADKVEGNEEKEDQDKDYAKEAEDYIKEQLDGLDMSEEEYIEYLAEQKVIEKLYDKIVDGIEVSQEDIDKYYEEELASQKENIAYAETRPVVLYDPPRVRVKHIIVEIPEDKVAEYQQFLSDEKEDEAKDLLEKSLKVIKSKADDVLKRAKEEDFTKLVEEVNPDSAEMMKEGITINKENPYLPDEYKEAAFKLKEDQISGLVASPQGYYIIKLEEKLAEKTYTMDEKKDDIKEVVKKQKQDDKWEEVKEDWKEKQIKKFEKRL